LTSIFESLLFLLLNNVKDARIAFAWINMEITPVLERGNLPEFSPEQQEAKSIWVIQQFANLLKGASLLC
jgi:hypothetical protein